MRSRRSAAASADGPLACASASLGASEQGPSRYSFKFCVKRPATSLAYETADTCGVIRTCVCVCVCVCVHAPPIPRVRDQRPLPPLCDNSSFCERHESLRADLRMRPEATALGKGLYLHDIMNPLFLEGEGQGERERRQGGRGG